MAGLLDGKAGLVTGGANGIGRACALAFAREGASVMIGDVDQPGGEETAGAIRDAGGRAEFQRCDVSRDADVAELVRATVATFGYLDFAHNNAGISSPAAALTADEEESSFDRILAVNLKGVWLGMRHEIPYMLGHGGGAIVNTASVGGLVGIPNASLYVASKHGVVGLTKTAAIEYVNRGIRVNAVCPGIVGTGLYDARPPETQRLILSMQPLERVGEPKEVAEVVMWLCSDAASLVTGVAMPVDGAWAAR